MNEAGQVETLGERRIVIFSGFDEIRRFHQGGGFATVGRNAIQRPRAEGVALPRQIMDVDAG